MTVREIQGQRRELYAVDASPEVTDAVLHEVREWHRPPGCGLSGGLFDALKVKIRDESVVKNKTVYLALALDWRDWPAGELAQEALASMVIGGQV